MMQVTQMKKPNVIKQEPVEDQTAIPDIVETSGIGPNTELHDSLHRAIDRGDVKMVRSLLDAGADVNKIMIDNTQTYSDTPLLRAIGRRSLELEIVQILIEYRADVNRLGLLTVDNKQYPSNPPLYKAIGSRAHLEVVQALIKAGADVNKAYLNKTPLYLAVEQGNPAIVQELMKGKPNVDKAYLNKSPLYLAVDEGKVSIVQELMKGKPDVNKTYLGNSPLEIARRNNNQKIVRLLQSLSLSD